MLFADTFRAGFLPVVWKTDSLLYGDHVWLGTNDSMHSAATTTATAAACHQRIFGAISTSRPAQAMMPQVAGGWSRNDRTENTAIPAMLPTMSSR